MNFIKIHFFFLILFCSLLSRAQTEDSTKLYRGFILGEVVVRDQRGGFDVDGFIQRVQEDTTFYKAFKTLHLMSFTAFNDIRCYDGRQNNIASYNSITRQKYVHSCRTMEVKQEKVKGDFYDRKRNYNYFTAELYDKLFFTHGKVCNENNIVGSGISKNESQRVNQLKQLIFNPGSSIRGVPGIGNKIGIFEEGEKQKYLFYLNREDYNGEDCYIFRAKPKPEYKQKVVINNLETWFRVSDFSIVARNYSLSYHTILYDFDVTMKTRLKQENKGLVPYQVDYAGNWHFIGKKRERVRFQCIFTDFN